MSSASSLLLADRYQLADRIAAGSSGEVWRGTDVVLARPVAIKLLQGGYAQHPETLARFRAEARHAGALSHEGIAHVYDYCESDPPHPPFLVMELVDGLSLAEMLAGGPVEPARAMDIIAQAAAGLHAAHLAGLVHRDIKPGNMLLSRGGIVKITDFGISHSAGSAPITSAGMLVGTAGYLAPERLGGARATPASDLYALGVVAYECLAGAAPFAGIPAEIALAHRDRPMPPLPAAVPADVAALVMELTAKDPAARPESADVVARRAARLRDGMTAGRSDGMTAGRSDGYGDRLDGPPATAAERPTLGLAPERRSRLGGGRPGRGVVLAATAVAVAAVVLALALTSVLRPAAPHHPVSVPSGTSKPASPAAQLIEFNVGSLIGQPVGAVVRQLHQLGLAVRVLWRPSSRQPSGMVLAVRPGGLVPAGSLVVVTGALQPQVSSSPVPDDKGKGKGNGGGNGNGKGKGKGKGNG
jgi:serine/threonine-protein kinase